MSGTTSVPSIQFTPTGLVIPAESAVLAGVQADMNAAFGGRMNPALNTSQGQFASSTSAIIGDKNDTFAKFVSQIDPATAIGFMQDAIGRVYFQDRLPGTPTALQVLCTGLVDVPIPVGALIADSNNNIYMCTIAGKIPVSGNITLNFECTVLGPVICAPALSIYKSIPGWDTVEIVGEAVLGSDVETPAEFEFRRQQTVALNARGTLPSIQAAVFDVDGVTDAYVIENNKAVPLVNGSITLEPKSIYAAAVGGLATDVAMAIWRKKSCGADYNGNTTVVVQDTEGYQRPYPSYSVKFQVPASQPILFAVQIANSPDLPSNIISLVQNAIILAFAGVDGGPRARIGATIYASRFYSPVSAIDAGFVEILSILIGTVTATQNAVTVDIGFVPTVTAANISVELV